MKNIEGHFFFQSPIKAKHHQ